MIIDNVFEIGQLVYLITDPEQSARFITAIQVTKRGLLYGLMFATEESWHEDYELSADQDIFKKLG